MTNWHLPVKAGTHFAKRPFMTTPTAVADQIRLLRDDGHTYKSALEAISHFPETSDEVRVLRAYIDAGYGDIALKEWVG